MIQTLLHHALSYVFPLSCPVCQGLLKDSKAYLCSTCASNLRLIKEPCCFGCGREKVSESFVCSFCNGTAFLHQKLYAASYYEGTVKKLLCAYKFNRRHTLIKPILDLCRKKIQTKTLGAFDMVCSVPMWKTNKAERGFNQTEKIASGVAKELGIPYFPNALLQISKNASQSSLDREQRIKNVENIYKAEDDLVSGKRILLVDDIITTGQTTRSCAQALIRANAACVDIFAVARGR